MRFRSALAVLALLTLTASAAPAADRTWTGGAGDGSFNTPSNWTGGLVPGGNDTATIAGATVHLTADASVQALLLGAGATLDATGFVLDLGAGPSAVEAGAVLRFDHPGRFERLDGPLAVRGQFDWGGGQVFSSAAPGGPISVEAGGTMRWFGAAERTVYTTVANAGTVRWEGGRTVLALNQRFTSSGTVEMALDSDVELAATTFGPGGLDNTGTIRKTGAGTLRITSVPFRTVGAAVDVQGGTLLVTGGSRWGNATVAVAAGATLRLAGNRFGERAVVAGTLTGAPVGTFVVGGLPGQFYSTIVGETGARLAITGTGLQLANAEIGGSDGTTTFPAPTNVGLMRHVGTGAPTYIDGPFVNEGTFRMEGSARVIYYVGASFTNLGLLEFAASADAEFVTGGINGGRPGPVLNTGTIRKTGPATLTSTVDLATVGGTVDVQGGVFRQTAAGRWEDATVSVALGATLRISSNRATSPQTVAGPLVGEPAGQFILGDPAEFATYLYSDAARPGVINVLGTGLVVANGQFGDTNVAAPTNLGLVRLDGPEASVAGAFRNAGTVRWTAGALRLLSGSRFETTGLLEVDLAADGQVSGPAALVVSGTLRTLGSALVTLETPLAVTGGTIDVQAGRLLAGRGSRWTDGTAAVADGATLQLGGNRGSEPNIVSGTLRGAPVGTFTLNVPGSYSILLSDPARPGMLDVGGSGLQVASGYLGGGFGEYEPYPTPSNLGLLRLVGPDVYLYGAVVNRGAIRWTAGTLRLTPGAALFNDGLFEVAADGQTLECNCSAGASTVRNGPQGVIRKTGAGRTDLRVSVSNEGDVAVLDGTLRMLNQTDNRFTVLAGGTLSGTGTLDVTQLASPAGRLLNGGTTAPGAGVAGAGVGTLTVAGPMPLGRLSLDVGRSASDQLVATGAAPLVGTAAIVRADADVQVGDAFDVASGTFAGALGQVVSLTPALDFTAATTPTGIRLTAGPRAAGQPLVVFPDTLVGGGPREMLITGGAFAPGATVRLDCAGCLDPVAHGSVAGEVVEAGPGSLRVRFDVAAAAVFGGYEVVVAEPGVPERRGAAAVVPVYSIPVFDAPGVQRVPVVPVTSQEGFRWSEFHLYNVSNNPEPTAYLVRLVPPPNPDVRVRLVTTVTEGGHRVGQTLWDRATDPNPAEAFLVMTIPPNERGTLALGSGISPENVDFSTAPTLTAPPPTALAAPLLGTSALADAAPERDPATGCLRNATFTPPPVAQRTPGGTPFGSPQEFAVDQVRGLAEDKIKQSVKDVLIEGTCGRFSRYLFQSYPDDFTMRLDRAVEEGYADLQRQRSYQPNALLQVVAGKLAGSIPLSDWIAAATDCGDLFGRAFTDRVRRGEKEIVDVLRQARLSSNRDLNDVENELAAKLSSESGRANLRVYNGFSSLQLELRQNYQQQTVTTQAPCTPLLPFTDHPIRPVGGAWDPNDKTADTALPCEIETVTVGGVEQTRCARHYVPLTQAAAPLPFTIHFENLPAALGDAETVTITDVLDPLLDPATLRVTGTSADSVLSVSTSGQTVTFTFAGIDLPPNTNAPDGEGTVSYEVSPRVPLTDGQTVRNGASIVFDFNPPIVTPVVEYSLRQVADPAVVLTSSGYPQTGIPYTTVWTLTNAGPDPAPNMTFDVSVAGGDVTSFTSDAGACADLHCAFGAVPPGQTATVTLVVTPAARGVAFSLDGVTTTSVVDGYLYNSRQSLTAPVVGVPDEPAAEAPAAFALEAPAPNPVRGDAEIAFATETAGQATVALFDLLGREVLRLVDADMPAGRHRTTFHSAGLAAGVYVVQLRSGSQAASRRLTVAR